MDRKELILFIEKLAKEFSFERASEEIEKLVYDFSLEVYIKHLAVAGVIPERYPHDSSEEKLYAKYLDSLLSRFFREFGFKSEVLRERGEAPDVLVYDESGEVVIAGDAKGFRLSRTAKNQKDFKVNSLRSWADKYKAKYACLLAPYFQYPSQKSQIYGQAIVEKVALISFEDCIVLLLNKSRILPSALLKLFDYSDLPEFESIYIKQNRLLEVKLDNLKNKADFYRKYTLSKILGICGISLEEYKNKLKSILHSLEEEVKLQLSFVEDRKRYLIDSLGELVQILKAEQRLKEMLEEDKLKRAFSL